MNATLEQTTPQKVRHLSKTQADFIRQMTVSFPIAGACGKNLYDNLCAICYNFLEEFGEEITHRQILDFVQRGLR